MRGRVISGTTRAILLCGLALGCGRVSVPTHKPSTVLRLPVLVGGDVPQPLSGALQNLLATRGSPLDLRIDEVSSTSEKLDALEHGKADLAILSADMAYLAHAGQLPGQPKPLDQLRAVVAFRLSPYRLVARPGSSIRTVSDLRGRTISIVSGMGSAVDLILGAFDITRSDVTIQTHEYDVYDEGIRLLMQGEVDALFDIRFRTDSLERAYRAGAYLVPISGPEATRLRRSYPFLRSATIRAGDRSTSRSVATIGVNTLLVCRADLDPNVVHEFTTRLFEASRTLASHDPADLIDIEQAPATSIPLHDGAALYFREEELIR